MKYTIEREDDAFDVTIEVTEWEHQAAEHDVGINEAMIPIDWEITCPDGFTLTPEEKAKVDAYVNENAEHDDY
jgi:hypothetical protein